MCLAARSCVWLFQQHKMLKPFFEDDAIGTAQEGSGRKGFLNRTMRCSGAVGCDRAVEGPADTPLEKQSPRRSARGAGRSGRMARGLDEVLVQHRTTWAVPLPDSKRVAL